MLCYLSVAADLKLSVVSVYMAEYPRDEQRGCDKFAVAAALGVLLDPSKRDEWNEALAILGLPEGCSVEDVPKDEPLPNIGDLLANKYRHLGDGEPFFSPISIPAMSADLRKSNKIKPIRISHPDDSFPALLTTGVLGGCMLELDPEKFHEQVSEISGVAGFLMKLGVPFLISSKPEKSDSLNIDLQKIRNLLPEGWIVNGPAYTLAHGSRELPRIGGSDQRLWLVGAYPKENKFSFFSRSI